MLLVCVHPTFLKLTPNNSVSAILVKNVNQLYCSALLCTLHGKMGDKHVTFQRQILQFLLPLLVLLRLDVSSNLRLRQLTVFLP